MKSSSELQSSLVTTSLLIHYISICDLVLKNNFVLTLIRYCFNFRCLFYIDTSLYASPSFLRGRCHLARRFCTFSFIRSFLSHAVKPCFPNFLKVHERDSLLSLLWSGQYLVVFSSNSLLGFISCFLSVVTFVCFFLRTDDAFLKQNIFCICFLYFEVD